MFLLSPKSCAKPWSESGDRELDLGELTRGRCSSRAAQARPVLPVLLTGLTGASPWWVFVSGNSFVRVVLSRGPADQFLACLELFC